MSELENALDYANVPFVQKLRVKEYLRSRQLQLASSQLPQSPGCKVADKCCDGGCLICQGFGFYKSPIGIWHPCPKCNGHLEDQH